MINWGNKKYGPQAKGIQIGPRVKSSGGGGGGTVMSKAGTPMKASTPKAPNNVPKGGWSYRPGEGAPKPKPSRKSTSKMR